jgi:hypothetical protein
MRSEEERRGGAIGKASKRLEGTSYSTAVKGKQQMDVSPPAERVSLEILPSAERLEELKGCFVGLLNHLGNVLSIQQSFTMEGLDKIKATPMGGKMVLLQSVFQGEVARAAENHKDWWDAHFKEVKVWTPNLVAKGRVVWIKIYGLPVHVWEEQTFKRLGSLFGEFLDFDESTITRQSLNVARIQIYSNGMSLIDEHLSIKVVGSVFDLWVVEDLGVVHMRVDDEAKEWDEQSAGSGDSGVVEVVGAVLGVQSDEEDRNPATCLQVQLGVESNSPRPGSTLVRMGQEEGQEEHFLVCQQTNQIQGEACVNNQIPGAQVDLGGEDIGGLVKSVSEEGTTTFNSPKLVGGDARVTPLKWKDRARASGKKAGGDTPVSLPISNQVGSRVDGVDAVPTGPDRSMDIGPQQQFFF